MLPIIGAGLINAGSQLVNNATAAWQNASANSFNREQADYNFSKEKQLYDEANVYNSPKMQMQRFEDAGLNKNLIYGQGTPGLAPASMPKYQDVHGTFGLPGVNSNSFATAINQYQDYRIKSAQVDLLKEQINNVHVDTGLKFWNKAMSEGNVRWKFPTDGILTTDQDSGVQGAKEFGLKSSAEYDNDFKRQALDKQAQSINNMMWQAKIMQKQDTWLGTKNKFFDQSNVNIDKDSLLSRYISDIFGDIIKKYSGKFTGAINKLF